MEVLRMKKKIERKRLLKFGAVFCTGFFLVILLIVIVAGYMVYKFKSDLIPPIPPTELKGIEKFSSEEEFKNYLVEAQLSTPRSSELITI